jgi:hypothetical protein
MKERRFSILREGYRTISALSPREAAKKFVARIASKEHHTIPTEKWEPMELLAVSPTVPAANCWAVVWRGEDPRVNRQVFLLWDTTDWQTCK